MGAVTLISNGSMVLLKYKLNNVCDPKGIRKPNQGGAQITEQFLYTTICCSCQHLYAYMYASVDNIISRCPDTIKPLKQYCSQ